MGLFVSSERPPAHNGLMPDPSAPILRGWFHLVAFFISLPAGVALVLSASGVRAKVAASIYSVTLAALFGTSAAYHRGTWSPRAKQTMRRMDHSMIYLLIAGTYTPIALVALHGTLAMVLLTAIWAGAALGVALKVTNAHLKSTSGALYIILGWMALLAGPAMVRNLPTAGLWLITAGGIVYTVGAIVLFKRKPNPSPRVFGYHEVWHTAVVAAAACHWVAILLVVR